MMRFSRARGTWRRDGTLLACTCAGMLCTVSCEHACEMRACSRPRELGLASSGALVRRVWGCACRARNGRKVYWYVVFYTCCDGFAHANSALESLLAPELYF